MSAFWRFFLAQWRQITMQWWTLRWQFCYCSLLLYNLNFKTSFVKMFLVVYWSTDENNRLRSAKAMATVVGKAWCVGIHPSMKILTIYGYAWWDKQATSKNDYWAGAEAVKAKFERFYINVWPPFVTTIILFLNWGLRKYSNLTVGSPTI